MSQRIRTLLAFTVGLGLAVGILACQDRTAPDAATGQIQWPGDGEFEDASALSLYIENDPVWKALLARFRTEIDSLAENSAGAGKYFDVRRWLPGSVMRWNAIQLKRPDLVTPDTAVLDISTGFGYFPLVGMHLFGINSIDATDAPGVTWSELYDAVTHAFGIRKYGLFVNAFEPVRLPNDGRRYDLVTSYMMVFDFWNGAWGEAEWQYFLVDVRDSLLREGGAVVLGFNRRNDVAFMEWAQPLGASYLGREDRAVVVVPWETLAGLEAP